MTRFVRLTFLAIFLLGMAGLAESASLKVSPARFIVHDVEPGRLYDIYKETGLSLTIYNDDDVSRTWVLSTHRPSERGHWEKGYAEIPDARWCWFDKDEIAVEPKSKANANLYLQIPEEEQYYNQHWVVTLNIGGKASGGISLAVDIRVQIETKSKVELKGRPHGVLGLGPSRIRFEDVRPGSRREGRVLLYNNDDKAHRYTIGSLFADSEIEQRTYLTHSYDVIPDSKWIGRRKKIKIGAGGTAQVTLVVKIPDDAANFEKKWEDILLVQPDEGRAEFVRVQVETRSRTVPGATQGTEP